MMETDLVKMSCSSPQFPTTCWTEMRLLAGTSMATSSERKGSKTSAAMVDQSNPVFDELPENEENNRDLGRKRNRLTTKISRAPQDCCAIKYNNAKQR